MHNKIKGTLIIAATAVLWSFGGLLIKLIPWGAMTIVGLRAVFAAAIMAAYMKKPRITLTPSVITGALCMSGTTILFVFANKLTTSANAIVLQYTSPVFIVILSALILKKRPGTFDIVSALIVIAGIALFFLDQLRAGALLGNILACLSGVTFAGMFVMCRMPDAKPEEALLLGHLINIVIGLPFIITHVTFSPAPWLFITLLGVFQLGISYVLFSIGIKITAPLTASLIAFLEPLLNPVWVLLLTGERPSGWALAGGTIVLATIIAYTVFSARANRRAGAAEAAVRKAAG